MSITETQRESKNKCKREDGGKGRREEPDHPQKIFCGGCGGITLVGMRRGGKSSILWKIFHLVSCEGVKKLCRCPAFEKVHPAFSADVFIQIQDLTKNTKLQ